MSRADFNNNPGNIRPPSGVTYDGQIGVDEKGFAIFENAELGRKALLNDIQAKIKNGLNNPNDFIDRYSPAGDNSEEARNNYKIHLAEQLGLKSTTDPFPKDSYEKLANAIASFEGGTLSQQSSEEKPPTPPGTTASAAGSAPGASEDEPPSNLLQGAVFGGLGATVGGGLGLTPKIQIPFQIASNYLNRNNQPAPVEAPIPAGTTAEGYPVSEFTPQTKPSKAAPKATAQDRIELGGTEEETGTSGRQRQSGYQARTAQEAARREMAEKGLKKVGLDPNRPLAEAPDMTATNRGTYVPKHTQEQMEADVDRKQQIAERTKALEKARQVRVAEKAGSEWQQLAAKAQEMSKSPDPTVRGKAGAVMNEAIRMWHEGSRSMRTPQGFGASVGAGLGFSLPYALDKYLEGDTSGAVKTAGTGLGLGAAAATVPKRAVPLLNFGLQGSEAIERAQNKDYTGGLTSMAGAIGPYVAPWLLGPEVGIPVGLGMAVGAPVANYVKDKYFPYKSALETAQPTK